MINHEAVAGGFEGQIWRKTGGNGP